MQFFNIMAGFASLTPPYSPSSPSSHPIGLGRALIQLGFLILGRTLMHLLSYYLVFPFIIFSSTIWGWFNLPDYFEPLGHGFGYMGLSSLTPQEEEEFILFFPGI